MNKGINKFKLNKKLADYRSCFGNKIFGHTVIDLIDDLNTLNMRYSENWENEEWDFEQHSVLILPLSSLSSIENINDLVNFVELEVQNMAFNLNIPPYKFEHFVLCTVSGLSLDRLKANVSIFYNIFSNEVFKNKQEDGSFYATLINFCIGAVKTNEYKVCGIPLYWSCNIASKRDLGQFIKKTKINRPHGLCDWNEFDQYARYFDTTYKTPLKLTMEYRPMKDPYFVSSMKEVNEGNLILQDFFSWKFNDFKLDHFFFSSSWSLSIEMQLFEFYTSVHNRKAWNLSYYYVSTVSNDGALKCEAFFFIDQKYFEKFLDFANFYFSTAPLLINTENPFWQGNLKNTDWFSMTVEKSVSAPKRNHLFAYKFVFQDDVHYDVCNVALFIDKLLKNKMFYVKMLFVPVSSIILNNFILHWEKSVAFAYVLRHLAIESKLDDTDERAVALKILECRELLSENEGSLCFRLVLY